MLPKAARETQRRHPHAYASLLVTALFPLVTGITLLGYLFKRLWPQPNALEILAGGAVMIGTVPVFIFLGVAVWVAVARRFVARPVAKSFYVYPGMGIFSRMGEWLFFLAYGKEGGES